MKLGEWVRLNSVAGEKIKMDWINGNIDLDSPEIRTIRLAANGGRSAIGVTSISATHVSYDAGVPLREAYVESGRSK